MVGVITREVDHKAVMEDNHFVGGAKVVKNSGKLHQDSTKVVDNNKDKHLPTARKRSAPRKWVI